MTKIDQVVSEQNIPITNVHGIRTARVAGLGEGLRLAKEILYKIVDRQTVLYLSGGRTPMDLYRILAEEGEIRPGAAGLIDERFGKKLHESSNELMIKQTGLTRYFSLCDTAFHPIIKDDLSLFETAETYDREIRSLLATYQKSVGILGIGLDGHTAGLPANPDVWKEYQLAEKSKIQMAVSYDDHGGFYKKRVTMSTLGLSMLDTNIVLVFGKDKKSALKSVFSDGTEESVTGRFFKRPDISVKTFLITDQEMI